MKTHSKPVRKCHTCPLNLGDRCWLYAYPRGQWQGRRVCRAGEDPEVIRRYEQWRKAPTVKSRREIRRGEFRVGAGRKGAVEPPGAVLEARERRQRERR